MHYVFTYIKRTIQNSASGSIQDNINIDYLTGLKFKIPKKNYQDKIASILSSLDAKIELNNRINAELEAMAKTLYDYWFVQFNFPDANGKLYKSSGGKMVYNQELKREIPEDWRVSSLGEFGEFKNGINYNLEDIGDTKARIINVRNISNSTLFISTRDLDEITLKGNDVRKYLVDESSILIARSGIPGATRLIHDYLPNTIYCGFIICFTVTEFSFKNNIFLHLKNFEKAATKQSNGTIMSNVNQETLKRIKITIPDRLNLEVIEKFNQTINPIFEKINIVSKENQKLTELRDWLLPMLMNGQVQVESAEEVLAMAAEPEIAYGNQSSSLNIPESKKGFAKQVLGGKIVSLFKDDSHFTHIKFQKLQYLAEHIAEIDLDPNYYFQAAGPYDNKFMHSIAAKFKASKWFDEKNYKFISLEKQSQIENYYAGYFGPVAEKLDQLFGLFADKSEAETEIIATLYAVWNNRIIKQQPVSDAELIADFIIGATGSSNIRQTNYFKACIGCGLIK